MIVLFVKRLAAILLSDSNNLMFETVLTKTENVLSSAK